LISLLAGLKAIVLNKIMRVATVLLIVAAISGAVGLIYQTPATGASDVQTGSRAHDKAGPMPLPADGIWELRRYLKLDERVEEAQDNSRLQPKRKGNQFSGHFVDKKAKDQQWLPMCHDLSRESGCSRRVGRCE
jgi:hypothetical protein